MKKVPFEITDTETGKVESHSAYVVESAAELDALLEKFSKPAYRCSSCGDGHDGTYRPWACGPACYADIMGTDNGG